MINIDKFWFEDPSILIQKDRLIEFFPSTSMHYIEKLNSIVRFSIYCAIVTFLYTKKINIIIFPLIIGAITLYIYKFHKLHKNDKESMGINEPDPEYLDCDAPTKDNPFMNVLVSDIQHNPHKKKACKITDTKVKSQVETNFNYNLYKDVTDVYSKNNSQRQFVANPITTIPNEQGKFANFLYNWKSSCKEDPKSCLRHEDVRQKREWAKSPKRKPMI